MKKYIKNRSYDTDTARKVASWCYGNAGDLDEINETLYQKRNGEYFIYGEGGAMSRYAEMVSQSSWAGGEDITPVTFEGAKAWMQRHCTAEEYDSEFGAIVDPEEHDLHVMLSGAAWAAIRRAADEQGSNVRAIIEQLAEKL